MYKGIDYGNGKVNIDKNGIRYGVIPHHAVGSVWYEESEPHYGDPTCPKCGNKATELPTEGIRDEDQKLIYTPDDIDNWEYDKHECADYCCTDCEYVFGNESAFPEEPHSWFFEDEEYSAESSDEVDIFILKSPYFTYAQFCSPCAPGAIYLLNPIECVEPNNRGYCFGADWFENEEAPYPIYSIQTGKRVKNG